MCGPTHCRFRCGHVFDSGQVSRCQLSFQNNNICEEQDGRPSGTPITRDSPDVCPQCTAHYTDSTVHPGAVSVASTLESSSSEDEDEDEDSDSDSGSSMTTRATNHARSSRFARSRATNSQTTSRAASSQETSQAASTASSSAASSNVAGRTATSQDVRRLSLSQHPPRVQSQPHAHPRQPPQQAYPQSGHHIGQDVQEQQSSRALSQASSTSDRSHDTTIRVPTTTQLHPDPHQQQLPELQQPVVQQPNLHSPTPHAYAYQHVPPGPTGPQDAQHFMPQNMNMPPPAPFHLKAQSQVPGEAQEYYHPIEPGRASGAAEATPPVLQRRPHDAEHIHSNANRLEQPASSHRRRRLRRHDSKKARKLREQAAEHDRNIAEARTKAARAEEEIFQQETRRAIGKSKSYALERELEHENLVRLTMLTSLEEYTAKLQERAMHRGQPDEGESRSTLGPPEIVVRSPTVSSTSAQPILPNDRSLVKQARRLINSASFGNRPSSKYFPERTTSHAQPAALRVANEHYEPSVSPTTAHLYKHPPLSFVSMPHSIADPNVNPEVFEPAPSIAGTEAVSLSDADHNRAGEEAARYRLFQEEVRREQWRQAHPDQSSDCISSRMSDEFHNPAAADAVSKKRGGRRN